MAGKVYHPRLRKQHPKMKNWIPFRMSWSWDQFRVQIVKFVTKHYYVQNLLLWAKNLSVDLYWRKIVKK